MKNYLILLLLLSQTVFAQKIHILEDVVGVGDRIKPEEGAAFVVQSTTKASLPCPKMTSVQRDAMATKPLGGCVYNSDTGATQFWDGIGWVDAAVTQTGLQKWASGTSYSVDDTVYDPTSNKIYKTTVAHVAGATFVGDIANWQELSDDLNRLTSVTDQATLVFDGTGGDDIKETPVIIDSTTGNTSGIGDLSTSGTATIGTLDGPLRGSTGVIGVGNIDLTSEVDNVLPIANGGTNSAAALTDDNVIYSQGGALVESPLVLDSSGNLSGVADLTATGTTTIDTALSGPLRATLGVVGTGQTDLSSEVTGVLPIANGGTNSSTALGNDRVMYSQGGAVVESMVTLDGSNNVSGVNDLTVSGTTTLDTGLTGIIKANAGVLSTGGVDLASDVGASILPIANGGTNSSTALLNDRMVYTQLGQIVESVNTVDALGNTGIQGNLDVFGYSDLDNIRVQANSISAQNINGDISLIPSGTGEVTVSSNLILGNQSDLRLNEDGINGSDFVGIQADANMATSYVLTMPNVQGGSGDVLVNNGLGGMSWTSLSGSPTTTLGDLIFRGAAVDERLALGTNGQVLTVNGLVPSWEDAPVSSTNTAKGDIQTHNGVGNSSLSVGLDDQVLIADATAPDGVKWGSTPGGIPLLPKGALVTSDGTNNGSFPACSDGEVIEWDAAETNGFKCTTPSAAAGQTINLGLIEGVNFDFEKGISEGWVTTGSPTLTAAENGDQLNGQISLTFDPSAINEEIRNATPMNIVEGLKGKGCQFEVRYTGGDGNSVIRLLDGTGASVAEITLEAKTVSGVESEFFFCPNQTELTAQPLEGQFTFQLVQPTATDAAAVTIDDIYFGSLKGLAETVLPDRLSAVVSGASSSVISDNTTEPWIDSVVCISGDRIEIDFTSQGLTETPEVQVSSKEFAGQTVLSESNTSISIRLFQTSGTIHTCSGVNRLNVSITKQGVDAKQSVQVYKSIPKVSENINTFTAHVNSSGAVLYENADWLDGDCTDSLNVFQCSFNFGIFTIFPSCQVTTLGSNNSQLQANKVRVVSDTIITFNSVNESDTTQSVSHSISCSKQGDDFKMPTVQPIIVGQVQNSRSQSTSKQIFEESCTITNSGTPSTNSSLCNGWIDSLTDGGVGIVTLNLLTKYQEMIEKDCVCSYNKTTGAGRVCNIREGGGSNELLVTRLHDAGDTNRDGPISIKCTFSN